jgi:hypothetical protein
MLGSQVDFKAFVPGAPAPAPAAHESIPAEIADEIRRIYGTAKRDWSELIAFLARHNL